MMGAWERLMDALEEQEDLAIGRVWQQKRAKGEVETMSLDELEEQMIADGLLPSLNTEMGTQRDSSIA